MQRSAMTGTVEAVSRSGRHTFSKRNELWIHLVEGLGVEGDAHMGATVQHRSRLRFTPHAPNLRQVHLMHAELHDELRAAGFPVVAGDLGENVTTRGVDLLALGTGTRLHLGESAVVEVTGLRNPCVQIDRFQNGLLAAVLGRDERGGSIRKSGIMAVVLRGGDVRPGDVIRVEPLPGPHRPLMPV
ncbi:MAG TPA: MOSC domain-containing protein [Longimicrobium sp.]